MKTEFVKKTLLDIALPEKGSIISGPFGSNISSKYFQESGVPVIRGNNLSKNGNIKFIDDGFVFISEEKADELNAYAIKDDLIFTAAGTIGQVGIIDEKAKFEKYVISNKQLRVRLDPNKVNPLYAYYWYSSPWIFKEIVNKNTGSTVPLINLGIIKSLEIKLPKERKDQDKIAAVLSALDAKIELNARINAELESMAKTLYDYWFVQKSNVGKLKVGKLGDFIEVNARSITKDYPHNEIEYIDIASVSTGRLEGITKYELKDAPSRARRLVKDGDTIWSTVRPNRKSYLFICNPSDNLVVSTGFAVLTPKNIPPSFLYFFTTTEQFINYLVSNAEGSAYPAVSADRFAEIDFSIPPEKKLAEFENIVNPMLTKISENEKESQTLTELRDWLLPMLMNGQVRV